MKKSYRPPMTISHLLLCFLFVFICNTRLTSLPFAGTEPEAWEPDEIVKKTTVLRSESAEKDSNNDLPINLIRFYQENINPNSISRCPFYISCSNFAFLAIQKYGFIPGVIRFIDRIYYREHPWAYDLYPKKRNDELYLKLNDSFFLNGGSVYD